MTSKHLQAIVIVLHAFALLSLVSMANAEEIAFYVSPKGTDSWPGVSIDKPFATIQKARDAVRTIKKEKRLTKPVTIYIRGGIYELSENLIFTVEDSGTESCPITYTAYQGEKPVISGGRKITGDWEKYQGEIMVCSLANDKNWNFRQLFANGERQIRSRIPNKDYYKIVDTEEDLGKSAFKYKESAFRNWHNLNDVEVIIFHSWNESRLLISELDEAKRIVTFTGPIGRTLGKGRHLNRYYIENVLEELDQPGEWYLDSHMDKLYYYPVGDIENLELRAPVLDQLLILQGDADHVQHINFKGLTFTETSWPLPEEGYPTCGDVGDVVKPSAITFNNACHCTFEDNCIRNVGTYALEITGYNLQIIGNEIYDTGSGGIISRNYEVEPNVISYNHIHHCGKVYASAVGINIDDGGGIISHNEIHHISHSCIYTRHWATEFQPRERRNQVQRLLIEYNEIYDTMHEINDGGGIFVRDSNILIRNNIIHDVYSYGKGTPGWGIYLGCETRDTRVENNLVYRTSEGLHVWYSNRNNIIENNIFVDGKLSLLNSNNPKDRHHENIKFLRNIFYYTKNDVDIFNIDGERSAPTVSDYNIFWNPAGCVWLNPVIYGMKGVAYFEEWQEKGFDTHSIVGDPLFIDKKNDNYSIKSNSPAFKIGFKPIDVSTVGLRGGKSK